MSLIKCTDCEKNFSDQASACPNCGKPNNTKYCIHCGSQIDKECVVCPKCGKQIEELNILNKNIVINNNNSSSSAASASIYNDGEYYMGKSVSKVAYILLALLLGGLGLHKFYSGKIFMGILYLLFCWSGIPAILGIIEAIIALFKPADSYGHIYF